MTIIAPQLLADVSHMSFIHLGVWLCAYVTVSALVIYDYLLTLSREVEVIWRKQLTNATSIIFLINRYNALFQAVMSLCFVSVRFSTDMLTWLDVSCKILLGFSQCSALVSIAIWAVFSALRVYTIGSRNVFLTSVALCLGLVPFGTNAISTVKRLSAPAFIGHNYCISSYVPPDDASDRWVIFLSLTQVLKVVVITRVCLSLSDLIVLYVTLVNTYSSGVTAQASEIKPSLLTLLIRDGVLLLALNSTQVILWLTNTLFSLRTILRISSIVISRFIMSLREVYFSSTRPSFLLTQYTPPSQLSTVQFTSVGAEGLTPPASCAQDSVEYIQIEGRQKSTSSGGGDAV
ncbi:hypothetical protein OBBRIDRAFT_799112 [Obba rivulosa]|uniref:DUF6533 domain-containing protein n=1 Tax=Obba rivulosa TaxID=1052685 RepID=A0A8E2ALD4_9APHY|nr:hypothetical protein OBBRIDRAFT_799112 [Obba rivulosa]